MKLIQDLLQDSLNGFASRQIPFFLFTLLAAALMGWLIQFIVNKKAKENLVTYGTLISAGVALLASIVKYSVPMSIIAAAALLLLLKDQEKSKLGMFGTVLLVVIGAGCGYGSIVQTGIGAILIGGIILFTPLEKNAD